MRILLKYPTRGRPHQFLSTLKGWLSMAADPSRLSVLVSYDEDDETMTPEIVAQAMKMHSSLVAYKGQSKTKIQACNADMDKAGEWDIVLLVSDDMFCRRAGWDAVVVKAMHQHFPDTDGYLWFHDGSRQREISTLVCMGRKYYQRFGFIYNEAYASFFCDNELTEIAQGLKKIQFIEQPLCTHEHPAWGGGMKKDDTYMRNNKFWLADQATYRRRKQQGFPSER